MSSQNRGINTPEFSECLGTMLLRGKKLEFNVKQSDQNHFSIPDQPILNLVIWRLRNEESWTLKRSLFYRMALIIFRK